MLVLGGVGGQRLGERDVATTTTPTGEIESHTVTYHLTPFPAPSSSRSESAKRLVRGLLHLDPVQRLGIEDACRDEWLGVGDGDTHRWPYDDPRLTGVQYGGKKKKRGGAMAEEGRAEAENGKRVKATAFTPASAKETTKMKTTTATSTATTTDHVIVKNTAASKATAAAPATATATTSKPTASSKSKLPKLSAKSPGSKKILKEGQREVEEDPLEVRRSDA